MPPRNNPQFLAETPRKRNEYLKYMLKELCTNLGPHPIGSVEFNEAGKIVKREMEKTLPVVKLDTFKFEWWVLHGFPELYVDKHKIESYQSHGTSGTSPEGITGTIKRIDDEYDLTYKLSDSFGKISAYISVDKCEKAVPRPYYFFKKEVKSLPIFHVGLKDKLVIEEAADKLTPVRLYSNVEFIPDTPSFNIVGTLPGKSNDEIVFIAHLDTVYNSQGANDNTASVIVMIMLAHSLSGIELEKTVTFIATSGEEYNEIGATNYVKSRKKAGTLQNIKFLINFDSLTWGPNMQINTQDRELRRLIGIINKELKLDGIPALKNYSGFQLDSRPFDGIGARAVYVNSRGYNNVRVWHRPEDTPDTVPFNCAEIGFQMFHEYVKRLQKL